MNNTVKTAQNILMWIGIAALLYMGGNRLSEETLKRISYGVPKIKVKKAGLIGLEIQIIMPITNRTPVGFPVDSLTASIFYGTNRITDFALAAPIIIESNNTTSLLFDVTLNYATLAQSVENVYNSESWLQYLRVEGTSISKGIVFPFDSTFQF